MKKPQPQKPTKFRKPPPGSADELLGVQRPEPEQPQSPRGLDPATPSPVSSPAPGPEADPLARLRDALAQEGTNLANHSGPIGYVGLVFTRLAQAIEPQAPSPALEGADATTNPFGDQDDSQQIQPNAQPEAE
jgi:hypothetical protein